MKLYGCRCALSVKSTLNLTLVSPIKNIAVKSAVNRRIKRGVEKKMKKNKKMKLCEASDDKRLAGLRRICHPVTTAIAMNYYMCIYNFR